MSKANKIGRFSKTAQMAPIPSFRLVQGKPGLYLVELRSHQAETHSRLLYKRKLIIPINPHRGHDELPKPVKIMFV
jgi:hypothetical protein